MDLNGFLDLDGYRREAKRLVKHYRAGDPVVRARAEALLGDRDRFLLSDAQHLLAREHGYRTWAELKSDLPEERIVDTGLTYGPGEPVRIRIRRRGRRYDLDDLGDAVRLGGKRPGWRQAAEWAVEPMNVSRQGDRLRPGRRGQMGPRRARATPGRERDRGLRGPAGARVDDGAARAATQLGAGGEHRLDADDPECGDQRRAGKRRHARYAEGVAPCRAACDDEHEQRDPEERLQDPHFVLVAVEDAIEGRKPGESDSRQSTEERVVGEAVQADGVCERGGKHESEGDGTTAHPSRFAA